MDAGLLTVIAGGVMEGSFTLPLKYTPKWKWENTWGAASLIALLAVPWPLAWMTVPALGEVYRHVSTWTLVKVILFGCGWGAGGIFLGLGVGTLGMSLGLSLIMGLIAIGGSVVPLAMEAPEQLLRPAGLTMMCGIAVMIFGIAVCASGGRMKEAETAHRAKTRVRRSHFGTGLLFCVLSGVLSPLVNFALIFGTGIAEAAARRGAGPLGATNAVWALVFTANYVLNLGYCGYLLVRNGTFRAFGGEGTGRYWFGALFTGLVWAGGIVVYGFGATKMGHFGAFVGFPAMLISSTLAGNALGALSGEWSGASGAAKRRMAAGVVLLVVAMGALGWSKALMA